MFGIEYPDPDKVEQEKKKQQALERDYEESGKAELTKLQTELADCFLSSWTFAMGEPGSPVSSASLNPHSQFAGFCRSANTGPFTAAIQGPSQLHTARH